MVGFGRFRLEVCLSIGRADPVQICIRPSGAMYVVFGFSRHQDFLVGFRKGPDSPPFPDARREDCALLALPVNLCLDFPVRFDWDVSNASLPLLFRLPGFGPAFGSVLATCFFGAVACGPLSFPLGSRAVFSGGFALDFTGLAVVSA